MHSNSEIPGEGTTIDQKKMPDEPVKHQRSILTHPAVVIGAFVLIGMLFALQEWINLRLWGYKISAKIEFESWGMQFLIWGVLCWLMGRFLQPVILRATPRRLLTQVLPLSIAACMLQEMIWVLFFPNLPLNHPAMHYWQRFKFHLDAELVDSLVIFWSAFFSFRGIAYYQQYREKETKAARLELQLAEARLAALRMQLNPHFLFNAMNSISSLMRSDVDAADSMLEQLSSLMRITLERGDTQLIPLRQEMEFIEIYLAMQERRYVGRIRQQVSVAAGLHDALVPALILQPLVENAFVHGISGSQSPSELLIDVQQAGRQLRLTVINSSSRASAGPHQATRRGIGLANVRARLQLHYGSNASLCIAEVPGSRYQATVSLPLEVATEPTDTVAHFDV
jgi:two-component system LytT family sensor kinase